MKRNETVYISPKKLAKRVISICITFSIFFVFSVILFKGEHCNAKIISSIEPNDNNVTGKEYVEFEERESIWDSFPIETDGVNIQVLDKISGKVFCNRLFVNKPEKFGNIELNIKRCFKNSPEDDNEIYAYIEIKENQQLIFSKWLLASSVSVNLFSHPIYDVRVEF